MFCLTRSQPSSVSSHNQALYGPAAVGAKPLHEFVRAASGRRGRLDETIDEERAAAAHALIFSIAHEIGNHLGAIRLHAHLLDEELDAHALAKASVEIDGLAGRAAPLLALFRPILSAQPLPPDTIGEDVRWSLLLAGVRQQIEDEGTRGVRFEIDAPADPNWTAPNVDWLHSLMIALVEATLAFVPRQATVRLSLRAANQQISLVVEDDGPEEDLTTEAALRGRPLAVAIARWLLVLVGGQVEAKRTREKTRVELIFPTMP